MAETLTSDNSVPAEVMESHETEIADSLRVGEELEAAHDQRLAGKYNSTEELEAAYLELQKKLGSQEDVQAEPEEASPSDWMSEAQRAIIESGQLSEEVVKQISEMDPLDVFKAMSQANDNGRDLSSTELNNAYDSVGGKDQYESMIDWATSNLQEAEINAYDAIIESGDVAQINLAIKGLNAQYIDAVGQDGNLLQGKPAQAQNGFRSQQELIEAMNDSRYDNDPAYRQDVLEKLDRSNVQF